MSVHKPSPPITMDTFLAGIWKENPVFIMVLGMCPTLAVSTTLLNSISMGIATTFVLVCSSAIISTLRHFIPKQVRIATYIVIIAAFVTAVDYIIQAVSLTIYNALGAFIQLIVVNCIILGRAEAYAAKHPVTNSIVNSLGMGIGFTIGLAALGSIREMLGFGTLLGFHVFGPNFQPWLVMVLPAGGFFVLAVWLLLFSWLKSEKARKTQESVKGEVVHG